MVLVVWMIWVVKIIMNKILMSSPEKTSIINDGKYRFSEDTTLTLEVEDFSKDIFLSVTSHKKVVSIYLVKILLLIFIFKF